MSFSVLMFFLLARDCGRWTPDSVEVRACWVSDGDLAEMGRLSGLTRIDLSMTRISDLGLLELKGLRNVQELNLRYAEQIGDEGMAAVKEWKKLRRVDLRGTKVTDTTLGYLGELPELEAIDAGFAQVTDNGIELLSRLERLRELTIGGNKLTDAGLEALRLLPSLEYLDISGPQRTDSGLWSVSLTEKGIASIATLRELRELRLGGTSITVEGLATLRRGLPRLERLSLDKARRVTDAVVEVLKDWKTLQEVDVRGASLSSNATAALRKALPGCVVRD